MILDLPARRPFGSLLWALEEHGCAVTVLPGVTAEGLVRVQLLFPNDEYPEQHCRRILDQGVNPPCATGRHTDGHQRAQVTLRPLGDSARGPDVRSRGPVPCRTGRASVLFAPVNIGSVQVKSDPAVCAIGCVVKSRRSEHPPTEAPPGFA